LNQKYIRMSDIFFEDFGIRKTKFAIQHFLRNDGKNNVRVDTKLPDDVKVVKISYDLRYAISTVILESKEFVGEQDEIQLQLTKIYDYKEKEIVAFT